MNYFEFYNGVNIISGKNSLSKLPKELEKYNCKNALIISGPTLTKLGVIKLIQDLFENKKSNINVQNIFNKIPNDSSLDIVNEIVDFYKKNNCDSIIAAGGGSVIDTAKAVKIVLQANDKEIRKYMGMEGIYENKQEIPFVIIPTTSGTGSEVTKVAVISDVKNNVKLEFITSDILPDFCILDPIMTKTLPLKATFTTGCDTLTHAIEAFTGTQSQTLTDMFALRSIALFREYIPKVIEEPNNLEYRERMMESSTLAGIAFSNSMVGIVHAIGHAAGGVSHVAHDLAMMILLPHCMRYNLDVLKDKYAKLLYYLVDINTFRNIKEEDRALKSIEVIDNIIDKYCEKLSIARNFKEAGIKEEDLERIAKTALRDGALLANVKAANFDDVMQILKNAYNNIKG